MAFDIAGSQILAQPVSGFLQGRAMRAAEDQGERRMRALEAAEGRAQSQESREQELFDESTRMRNTQVLHRAFSQIESAADPVAEARRLAQSPELAEIFQKMGRDPMEGFDGKTPEQIRAGAAEGRSQLEPLLSKKEPEAYTLGKGDKRFVGGKLVAENTAPDEDDWTNPEAVVIGGKKVMAQVNKRTGEPRVVPGATPIESDGGEKDKSFERANTLRDEYNLQSKDYGTVKTSYETIKALGNKPSAAGDIALLTAYMRMVDPGSSVKEGEFANAENAGGVSTKVRARYNNLLSGERLTDEQRKDFISQSGTMLSAWKASNKGTRKRYKDLASRAKLDPLDVIGADESENEEAPTDAPPVTATGPNGQKLMLKDGKWVPFNG
jgi:hypothetical protein